MKRIMKYKPTIKLIMGIQTRRSKLQAEDYYFFFHFPSAISQQDPIQNLHEENKGKEKGTYRVENIGLRAIISS